MLQLKSSSTYSSAGNFVQLEAVGGLEPYVYSLVAGGDGGSINSLTGLYQSPNIIATGQQVIRVTDDNGDTANFTLVFLNHLQIIANIIGTFMNLASDQIYIYNQKFNIPKDNRLYVAVKLGSHKIIGTKSKFNLITNQEVSSTNLQATITIDFLSRSLEALNRKEELFLSLTSQTSQVIQNQNSFKIAQIPSSMTDLSQLEGSAIPYRFNTSFNIIYSKKIITNVEYYTEFRELDIITEV